VYVTAYTGYGVAPDDDPADRGKLRRHLICFDASDGSRIWTADLDGNRGEHDVTNYIALHGYASSTPAADADGVYVCFGTGGVLAFDHQGRERWRRELGRGSHSWGTASSPVIFRNLLIVHADIEAQALLALDKRNGEEAWRVSTGSTNLGDSWSTPLLLDDETQPELVFHRSEGNPATLAAVDPRNGTALWECRVLKDYLVPSPVGHEGVVYAIAHQRAAAVRVGGRGDVTNSHVLWTGQKGSEICTPVYHEGHLYWTSEEGGLAYCVNAATGEVVYQERLSPNPGRIYASAVLAEGRIYYCSRESGTYVVAAKPEFELLAHNVIETDPSVFNGTPAISPGRLYLRSDSFLYGIAQ
jgi:outer membrane protein assembly factor BamB